MERNRPLVLSPLLLSEIHVSLFHVTPSSDSISLPCLSGSFLSLHVPGPSTSPCLTVADQPRGRWGSETFCLILPTSPLHTRGRSHLQPLCVAATLQRETEAQGDGLVYPGLPRSKCHEDSNPSSGKIRDTPPQCPGDTSSQEALCPARHTPTLHLSSHREDSPLGLSGSPSPCQELATS